MKEPQNESLTSVLLSISHEEARDIFTILLCEPEKSRGVHASQKDLSFQLQAVVEFIEGRFPFPISRWVAMQKDAVRRSGGAFGKNEMTRYVQIFLSERDKIY